MRKKRILFSTCLTLMVSGYTGSYAVAQTNGVKYEQMISSKPLTSVLKELEERFSTKIIFSYEDLDAYRSLRSFTWGGDETAVDSMRYSVWSTKPNNTGTYLVCHINGDDAYFTLDKPKKIEYILVSNTTWDYLAMTYGDTYGTAEKPMQNPNIPSKPKGIWHTYVEGGVKKFGENDYFIVTAKGYLAGSETGSVSFDLACKKGHNADHPTWDYVVADWMKMDLTALGTVDKVVFYLDSSDKDENGKMRTPAWFCLDGFQFAK